MYPEDRVLVAYMPDPSDLELIKREGWYRIPQKYAPKGLFAEYFAFYFGSKFGPDKWAIHYYARQYGYELVKRSDLFPNQADHPRANDNYYKVSLGPLETLPQPIVSLRWRRVTFLHTTWDRLQGAREINDLILEGGEYCDRLFATLKERGIRAERDVEVKEKGKSYRLPLVIPISDGSIEFREEDLPASFDEVEALADEIESRAHEIRAADR